jgi:hypothetical protein
MCVQHDEQVRQRPLVFAQFLNDFDISEYQKSLDDRSKVHQRY